MVCLPKNRPYAKQLIKRQKLKTIVHVCAEVLPKNVKPKAKKPVITIPLIIKEVNDSMENNSELFSHQELY